jgi:hypothetical protein
VLALSLADVLLWEQHAYRIQAEQRRAIAEAQR